MLHWKAVFYIDGKRFEQVYTANSSSDVRFLIKKQFAGCNVSIFDVVRV
ncbi:MAG: hypothetical protein IJC69_02720 [Clostridia bacterium]|nr:hypothetical protein [Clostridia bacterium]